MSPRHWNILLWVLFVSTTAAQAHASARESRRGTLLVAGGPETPPLLYVAADTVTRVRFVDLLEPHARPGSELQGRIEVAPLGEGSLVVSPVKNLAQGERLLLPVAGRTEAGESLTLTLALVTREDTVDAEVWVSRARMLPLRADAADTDEASAIARGLLVSHDPGTLRPRLALALPDSEQVTTYSRRIRASAGSVLRMDGLLFVTVLIQARHVPTPWRLIRARLEAGCRRDTGKRIGDKSLPTRVTSGESGHYQFHTFAVPLPEGTGCLSLTLEEDGPRTLRLRELKVSP
ncbi:DUF2381 family protein [Archangium lansingense]|uniref:DUF2381 family protein n=1 Tax=Archangium lansingense TaxID=2995310 RepID=A0ABT4AJJ6_9BACT|nr:DUF2381 family protein [Archangium lansinium]MCY1081872.1 DUF2381 family protein [Archangium lansinium]